MTFRRFVDLAGRGVTMIEQFKAGNQPQNHNGDGEPKPKRPANFGERL